MAIRERCTQRIFHDKWDDMMEVEKDWDAVEEAIGGVPKKRRSRPLAGKDWGSELIWEREWDSLAQMEATYRYDQTYKGDIDLMGLMERTGTCVADRRVDIYRVLP